MTWLGKLFEKILVAQGLPADGATPMESVRRLDAQQRIVRTRRPAADGRPYHIYTTQFDQILEASQFDAALGSLPEAQQAQLERDWHRLTEPASLVLRAAAQAMDTEKAQPVRDGAAVVSLLIDHSGSMRGQSIAAAALTSAMVVQWLCGLGIAAEVLGFTTRDWRGGESRKLWIERGRPSAPGRLCDLRHIIYVSADDPPGSALALTNMLRPDLLRENVDGEAVEWAVGRLEGRPEPRKLLLVLSDGAPVDDSTNANNPEEFLEGHLRQVARATESKGIVTLMAIGIGHPKVTEFYTNASVVLDPDELPAHAAGIIARWLGGDNES